MVWVGACGEFIGSAGAAFVKTKAKLEQQEICQATDFCPEETKQFVSKSLAKCQPSTTDLTWWGRRITEFNLGRNDYFGSLLAIDANFQPSRRKLSILALKTAAKSICSGYDEDPIRAVTYSYLALNYLD
jgi:hypothetical protein